MFTYHRRARVAQQLIVMQQRTRNRVLYGQHTDGSRILLDTLEHLFEGGTADELYLFSLEIQVRRNVVERPRQSLYGNPLHILLY
jgi:hypothetical protein